MKGSTDLDECDFEDDEGELVNEDDTEPERENEYGRNEKTRRPSRAAGSSFYD